MKKLKSKSKNEKLQFKIKSLICRNKQFKDLVFIFEL